jgi:TRAP transporter TAXI family solute receptor
VELTRRQALRVLGATGFAAALGTGCGSPFAAATLRIATASPEGEYYRLGGALAQVWQERLGLATAPEVLPTEGSGENVQKLVTGVAQVAISQLDVAADRTAADSPMRALAAIYNDAVQVVVPADSPFRTVADLRGARVAIGAPGSGVAYLAARVLNAAGLDAAEAVQRRPLGLTPSIAALRARQIDAFFWVGALPTTTLEKDLVAHEAVRLLDLTSVLEEVRRNRTVYTPSTVLADTYRIAEPVATLLVRNVLLVDGRLGADLVEAMTAAVFAEQQRLVDATAAARTIDVRPAVFTQPVELHPGALRWFSQATA